MWIKYSYKNKAKNYKESDEEKYVLPDIRQRLHYQLTYSPVNGRSGKRWWNMCVHPCSGKKYPMEWRWGVV